MPRKRTKNYVQHLDADGFIQVFDELLDRHPELWPEVNEMARDLLEQADAQVVAEDIVDALESIDMRQIRQRSGRQPLGHIEPYEAIGELFDEAVEDVLRDFRRKLEAGLKRAAETVCQGIILGLYRAEAEDTGEVLGEIPDHPSAAAVWSLTTLLESLPQRERRAAGERVLAGVCDEAGEWRKMLEEAARQAARAKRRGPVTS